MKMSPLRTAAFTLVELLVVMVIILLLAGLVLGTVSFAQKKAARSRSEGEIFALSSACEAYKTDNAVYPRGNANGTTPADDTDADTDKLNANYLGTATGDPSDTKYTNASLALYTLLSGDTTHVGKTDSGKTNYLSKGFKDDLYARTNANSPIATNNKVTYLSDPFGNAYGYSTANSHAVAKAVADPSTSGYNPTFDLWSTGGDVTKTATKDTAAKWVKNW